MQLSPEIIETTGAAAEPFTPPYPERPATPLGLRALISAFRRNIISVFSAGDFATPLIRTRVLARDVFICNSPELVRAAFTTQHEAFQRKTPQMRHALEPLLGDGLFVSDGAVWRQRRAIMTPIVHASQTARFAPIMAETARDWRDHWAAAGEGAEINVLGEMGELTAEIISRSVFGRRLGRGATAQIVQGFAAYQSRIDQVDILSILGLPDWLPRWRPPAVRRSLARVHEVIDDIIDRFDAGRGEGGDEGGGDQVAVIGKLFEATDEAGRPLSREAIRNEAIVTFMAGHETTANTLAWAWYLVSQSPRVRAKLHDELAQVLAGRDPDYADVPSLPFTRAIIEETLRLYPPVPVLGRQALSGGVIDGQTVRKGALVLVVPWLLHRNPTLWTRPDEFIPERFDGRIAPRPEKHAYVPFATGPRICPGMIFGLTEAVICLATLAQSFTVDLAPGHDVAAQCRLTLRPGDALPMVLHRRVPAPVPV